MTLKFLSEPLNKDQIAKMVAWASQPEADELRRCLASEIAVKTNEAALITLGNKPLGFIAGGGVIPDKAKTAFAEASELLAWLRLLDAIRAGTIQLTKHKPTIEPPNTQTPNA